MNRPNQVTLGSKGLVTAEPSWRLPSIIVRNFRIVNSRPFFPGRRWRNSTAPLDVNFTSNATAIITGKSKTSSKTAPKMSHALFNLEWHHELTWYEVLDASSDPCFITPFAPIIPSSDDADLGFRTHGYNDICPATLRLLMQNLSLFK